MHLHKQLKIKNRKYKLFLETDSNNDFANYVERVITDIIIYNRKSSGLVIVLTDKIEIEKLIQEFHDSPIGGDQSILRTYNRIKKYSFPKMLSSIRKLSINVIHAKK